MGSVIVETDKFVKLIQNPWSFVPKIIISFLEECLLLRNCRILHPDQSVWFSEIITARVHHNFHVFTQYACRIDCNLSYYSSFSKLLHQIYQCHPEGL